MQLGKRASGRRRSVRPRPLAVADQCLGRDSNPHGSRRGILSALCLPIPPPKQGGASPYGRRPPGKINRRRGAVYGLSRAPASSASRRRRTFSSTLAFALYTAEPATTQL